MTKDNEINKILDRAEKYRKQLHSTEQIHNLQIQRII